MMHRVLNIQSKLMIVKHGQDKLILALDGWSGDPRDSVARKFSGVSTPAIQGKVDTYHRGDR
jgi:hypothetical protein